MYEEEEDDIEDVREVDTMRNMKPMTATESAAVQSTNFERRRRACEGTAFKMKKKKCCDQKIEIPALLETFKHLESIEVSISLFPFF